MYHQVAGSGPPLLLLHGFTGNLLNWEPLVPYLVRSHTIITVDLPGHGKTGAITSIEAYQMASISAELVRLMEELGHPKFDLLGYSMGGRTALFLATHYPNKVTHLVLESASPGLKSAEEREARTTADNALADRIERDGIKPFVDFWESISLWESQGSLSDAAKSNLRQIRLSNDPAGLARSLRGMGTGQQPSLWSKLSQLKIPTLLLTGELDAKFCAIGAEMDRLLPHSQHQIVPNAGHTIHLEQPTSWLQQIENFLAERKK